ncbi:MAG: hypothetical protein IT376_14800 [Polyangiaceae bacterium]|nr:hypothetical protein [Polyangiaceae bacterium]
MTFKARHPELQHLVRELHLLRNNNLRFKEGDPRDGLMLFAEAGLVLLVLERFLRAILDPDVTDGDALYNLLQRAVSRGLVRVPWDDQEDGIKKLKDVRNTILHGNYEQAARQAGGVSIGAYFKAQFASEVEAMFKVTDHLMRQIDHATGRPWLSEHEPQAQP